MVLAFESVDEILLCDHLNKTSSGVLAHGTVCIKKFYKMNLGFFLNLILGTLGSKRVNLGYPQFSLLLLLIGCETTSLFRLVVGYPDSVEFISKTKADIVICPCSSQSTPACPNIYSSSCIRHSTKTSPVPKSTAFKLILESNVTGTGKGYSRFDEVLGINVVCSRLSHSRDGTKNRKGTRK